MISITPHLMLITGDNEQRVDLAGKHSWTIGRVDDCDITIDDRRVSREHAEIYRRDDGSFHVIDQGSNNGTMINGRPLTIPVCLEHGDSLTIGPTQVVFHDLDGVTKTTGQTGSTKWADATERESLRRLISVLVVDIRDFTVLARELGEEHIADVMGKWCRAAGKIIHGHNSTIVNYTGDGLMAVWFHPSLSPDVNVVLDLLRSLMALKNITSALNKSSDLPIRIRLGAGVKTGFAMAGQLGALGKSDYTVQGDIVIEAFRLESATKKHNVEILLGPETYKCVSGAGYEIPYATEWLQLKGYETQVEGNIMSFDDLAALISKIGKG